MKTWNSLLVGASGRNKISILVTDDGKSAYEIIDNFSIPAARKLMKQLDSAIHFAKTGKWKRRKVGPPK